MVIQAERTVPLPFSSCLHSEPSDKGTISGACGGLSFCDVVVCPLGSLLRSAAHFGSCSTGQLQMGTIFGSGHHYRLHMRSLNLQQILKEVSPRPAFEHSCTLMCARERERDH